MSKLKWGIVGAGNIAQTCAKAINYVDEAELNAVASRDIEKSLMFAREFSIPKAYGSYAEILADDDIDIIYVATVHSAHYSLVKSCLEAGKHVMVEKPITITGNQAEELIFLSSKHNKLMQEAMWSRFMPSFSKIKQWIDDSRIGELQYIQSDIGFSVDDREHRLHDPTLGGGALLDLGVYPVSICQYLLHDSPSSIDASARIGQSQVDEHTLVNMRYPSGVYAQFTCSISSNCTNTMRIVGSQGFIDLPRYFWTGELINLYQGEELIETLHQPHTINGFEHQVKATSLSVNKGQLYTSCMSHEDTLSVMRTLDDIRSQIGLAYSSSVESV